jgi:RNA polymerase sigma-70 factor (ECF subfamily)
VAPSSEMLLGDPPCVTGSDFTNALQAVLPALQRRARYLSKDAAAAEDLVQDTLVRAWAAWDRFQPGTNFKAWLFTILRNVFLNDLRRRRFRGEWKDFFLQRLVVEAASQETAILLRECRDAIDVMSQKYREPFLAIVRDGASYEEAALRLRLSLGTVKSRVFRARAIILDHLANGHKTAPASEELGGGRLVYRGFAHEVEHCFRSEARGQSSRAEAAS